MACGKEVSKEICDLTVKTRELQAKMAEGDTNAGQELLSIKNRVRNLESKDLLKARVQMISYWSGKTDKPTKETFQHLKVKPCRDRTPLLCRKRMD